VENVRVAYDDITYSRLQVTGGTVRVTGHTGVGRDYTYSGSYGRGELAFSNTTVELQGASSMVLGWSNYDYRGFAFGTLDLANSTVASDGTNGLFKLGGTLDIGFRHGGPSPLLLPPDVTEMDVNKLYFGVNNYYKDPGSDRRIIDFGSNTLFKTLIVRSDFQMGWAKFQYHDDEGTHSGLPDGTEVTIGASTNARAFFHLGWHECPGSSTLGTGISRFTAYLTQLRIGYINPVGYRKVYPYLDLRKATLEAFDIAGNAYIGYKPHMNPRVYLPEGRVSAYALYMGYPDEDTDAYMSLSNTVFAVRDSIRLRDNTRVYTRVDGVACGLDLADTNLTVEAGALVSITFASDPLDSAAPYWGLRVGGEMTDELAALTNAARVTYDVSGLSASCARRFGVHYHQREGYSYLGVAPPSGTIIVLW
jgi:hypothetical protein